MEGRGNKLWAALIYPALALATFAAFESVRHNQFVDYDDYEYVIENPRVQAGLTRDSVRWAFTTTYQANWHPLTWLSHMLDCELFGLNPLWHHLTSLLFHIANTLLLFWVLKRLTAMVWCSVFVAVAFALHPLHVESVAWVAERKDVLSGFFWMLTMAAYLRYAKQPGIGRYLLVALALCLGLMAKPMLVTLPFVLLLLDYWPLGRFQQSRQDKVNVPPLPAVKAGYKGSDPWRLLVEKIPLFVIVAISSVVTFMAQRSGGAVNEEDLALKFRIANALVSYISYIGKLIWPSPLAVLYPHPGSSLPMWQPIVSFIILAGVSAGIYAARRHRYLVVGWLWYLGTLVPVIGLVQVGTQAMADRYTYLPSIGIFIMAAWGVAELLAKWRYRELAMPAGIFLLTVILLICTRMQVSYWQSGLTLFGRAIKVTRNNYKMHNNYGLALFNSGQVNDAILHYEESLRINPKHSKAQNNIGLAFLELGKTDEAVRCFSEAVRLVPDYLNAINNLGVALEKQGRYDQALEVYERAIKISPGCPDTYLNIGIAMAEQNRDDNAIKYFNRALQLKPDWPMVHYCLATIYHHQGKLDQVVKHCTEALRLKPDFVEVRINLARTLVRLGKIQPAIEQYYETLKFEADSIDALNDLAWILATTEDTKLRNSADAIKFAERASNLTKYEKPEMLATLAAAYAAAGNFPEAVKTAEKAIKLAEDANEEDLAKGIQERLGLYKSDQPYRGK